MNCLCCGKPIIETATEQEKAVGWHNRCVKRFFGTKTLPDIEVSEDVLEQLVGDIWDESDVIEEEFKEVSPNRYEVDGDMRLDDFFAEFDKDEEEIDDDNATVGGWAVEMLGGYPKLRESFTFEDLTVTILKRNNLRVLRLLVEQDPNWVDEDEPEDELIDE